MDMEDEEELKGELNEPVAAPKAHRVSFGSNARPANPVERKRSPPPDQFADLGDEDDEEEDDMEDDDEDDEGLSLQRYESGSARQPQMIDDESDSDEEDELKSPPPIPNEEELRMITGSEGDEELEQAYEHVAGCPCHGQEGPHASHIWEIPQKPGQHGGRYAVVAIKD